MVSCTLNMLERLQAGVREPEACTTNYCRPACLCRQAGSVTLLTINVSPSWVTTLNYDRTSVKQAERLFLLQKELHSAK